MKIFTDQLDFMDSNLNANTTEDRNGTMSGKDFLSNDRKATEASETSLKDSRGANQPLNP